MKGLISICSECRTPTEPREITIVGVEGLDEEQLQLGSSEKFWTLIEERRKQKTLSRAALERTISNLTSR